MAIAECQGRVARKYRHGLVAVSCDDFAIRNTKNAPRTSYLIEVKESYSGESRRRLQPRPSVCTISLAASTTATQERAGRENDQGTRRWHATEVDVVDLDTVEYEDLVERGI